MSDNGSVGTVSVLDRPVYGVAQAAALLGLRGDRVRAWLDGYQRGGHDYPPVVRSESAGLDIVTWGEFVELGYLREYRVDVSLQRIRPVIAELKSRYGTSYPLAHARPWVYDHELVLSV